MNKEIEKAQKKLDEAKKIREQKKVRYDTHVIIVEGQRRTLNDLEKMNQELMREFMDSDRTVSEYTIQLNEAVSKFHEENEQIENN